MENNTSPHHGGNIPKKDRSPISMLKTYTPDAAPESQYPPATEQPEEGYVVGLRADSFESVCQVITENQVLQAKLAASEKRVKALEEALRTIADGRGIVPDKSTIYMNGRTPEVPTIFNKHDMQEIAKIALEVACQK